MKKTLRSSLLAGTAALALAATARAEDAIVAVALNEYVGPEAYFAVYLVNPEGRYEQTLWHSGPEKMWWPDEKRWFGYFSRSPADIDSITGASTAAGTRRVLRINIDPEWVDAGYTMRVETSVEAGDNHQIDAEVELTHENERVKTPGMGYVRYLRYKL